MEFTQEETKRKFNKLNEKITSVERNLFSLKKDFVVIQTTISSWVIKMKTKLWTSKTVPGAII